MAGQAGVIPYRGGMAGAAGGITVIDASSFLVHARFRVREAETGQCPGRGRMAVCTIGAESAEVEFRVGMTGNTLGGGARKGIVGVALFTRRIDMSAGQREIAATMIEGGVFPIERGMAGSAICTKAGFVRIVGSMAGVTVGGRYLEISQVARIDMTLHTDHTPVLPCQFEGSNVVIELFSEPVDPIVASQAGRAKRQEMRLGKDRVHLAVAGITRVRCEGGDVLVVTVRAGERLLPDREPVSVQGKSQQLMREFPTLQGSKRGIGTTMFGMAIAALQFWILLVHRSMQRDHTPHLACNLPVAVHTQISHRDGIPGRTVTGSTPAAGLRMRPDATQHFPRLGVQGSGVIHQATARVSNPCDDKSGDKGRQNSQKSQTTQSITAHTLSH